MSSQPSGATSAPYFSGALKAATYIEEVSVSTEAQSEGRGEPAAIQPSSDLTATWMAVASKKALGEADDFTLASIEPLDDLAAISSVEKVPAATQGWRGVLNRLGVSMRPGQHELAELDADAQTSKWEAVIRQFVGTAAVGVLVANPKGSSGKTPTSIVLGGLLATIRGGSVAVLEVSDDRGTLSFRAEGNPSRGVAELVRDAAGIRSAGQLAGYTAPQTSYASVIGSVGNRAPLTHDDVVSAARVIDEFYAIRVMDSGNQPTSSAFAGAVETAEALVVPVLNSADVVLGAVAMLDRLRSGCPKGAQLASNAIIVRLVDGRPENPKLVARLDAIIESAGVGGVFTIPYDPHIAERGQITLGKVSPATRAAFTAAAAAVVHSIQKNTK